MGGKKMTREELEARRMRGPGGAPTRNTSLPTEASERKKYPMFSGLIAYFPDALAEVSNVSWRGNEQHNPGLDLRWTRGKSSDEMDTTVRHLSQAGTRDVDGVRHLAKAAWRTLAALQKEIEAEQDAAVEGSVGQKKTKGGPGVTMQFGSWVHEWDETCENNECRPIENPAFESAIKNAPKGYPVDPATIDRLNSQDRDKR